MAVPVAICDLRQSQSQALHRPSHTRQGWGQFNSGIGIAAQFQFLFRNWNWNWNWWNWKWNWNWNPWNWNWKPELNFWQLLPQHLLVNQLFPNYSFNQLTEVIIRWRLVLYFPDTEFHTFFSGQVPISSDIHVVRTFPDMSGARLSCRSWPDCSLRPFP